MWRFASLVLLEGVYSLTLSVTDHTEAHPYDHWERRIHFEVRQTNIYDAGMVFMPSYVHVLDTPHRRLT